ncbi:MAG: hypothetical protein SWJ54_22030 [Cyanobacteriota bacterium]|nr:hypothetical protein [Cyanobacteriota bacterium]
MGNSKQQLARIDKLARKSPWATAILTLVFLPAGYVYTGRFKALIKGFGLTIGILALCSIIEPALDDNDDFSDGVFGLYAMVSTLENTRAVHKAKKLKAQSLANRKNNKIETTQIQLLKFAKRKGAVTVSDCVIETGLAPQDIRNLLDELHREDLMRIDNRDEDGAVIYRVV